MTTQADVRKIALSLPGARVREGHFGFTVENKGKAKLFAWVWLERVHPKKPRVPCEEVLAVRVRDRVEKRERLASEPEKLFTEPHYDGFPAVLVRLPLVSKKELRELIVNAWRCQAPAATERATRRPRPRRPR